jgi:hypothetical protein
VYTIFRESKAMSDSGKATPSGQVDRGVAMVNGWLEDSADEKEAEAKVEALGG